MFRKGLVSPVILTFFVTGIFLFFTWASVSADEDCDPHFDFLCPFEQEEPEAPTSPATAVPEYKYYGYTGSKKTIAVLSFENKIKGVARSSQLGAG
jgi:hypothetical protein